VEIKVYRDPESAEGREALLFFESKGIQWQDVDVTAEAGALQQMQALSGQTERPVIVVDGQVLIGCDPASLEPLVPSHF
jgi:glutaredoxin